MGEVDAGISVTFENLHSVYLYSVLGEEWGRRAMSTRPNRPDKVSNGEYSIADMQLQGSRKISPFYREGHRSAWAIRGLAGST